MINQKKELLIIFVKNPEKGHVKTRLAKSVGEERALEVYEALLEITKQVTLPLNCEKQVWYSKEISESDLWDDERYEKRVQRGENLGGRMQNAFRDVFESGFEKVVIIGSDCADLTQGILEDAFAALDHHRAVIGPSEDGGYYLLGMADFFPDLFEEKSWSTDSVYQDTLIQMEKNSISCFRLPELNDIDTESDLKKSNRLNL